MVRTRRLAGRKQFARLMILMVYSNFMSGVEPRVIVPFNVNRNLVAGRGVLKDQSAPVYITIGDGGTLKDLLQVNYIIKDL